MSGKNIESGYPKPLFAWGMIGALSLAYMFSIIDRSILALLIDPMKEDLQITDTQISILTGFAFAGIYAVTSLPMGRVSDLWSRKYVIMFGITVWSVLTVSCGFAKNFMQLFLARMGVGFGEAALTPTAHAMIPDLFPPHKLARGMSVFVTFGLLGGGLSLVVGGAVVGLADNLGTIEIGFFGVFQPWQTVLLIVGALSLLTIIPFILLPEPARHKMTGALDKTASQKKLSAVFHYIWEERGYYVPFIIGFSLISMMTTGLGAWVPSYFIRVLGWSATETGAALGIATMAGTVVGGLGAGLLSDYLYKRGDRTASLKLMIILAISAAAGGWILVYVPYISVKMFAIFSGSAHVAALVALKPTTMQLITPNHMRGQIAALALFSANFIGYGSGSTVVALVTDHVFKDPLAVGHSIFVVGTIGYGLGALLLFLSFKTFKQISYAPVAGEMAGDGEACHAE